MPMPVEAVAQVHCLARQVMAKKTHIFTNTRDEDLHVLYAATDVDPVHVHDKLVGVDGEDGANANNKDYNSTMVMMTEMTHQK